MSNRDSSKSLLKFKGAGVILRDDTNRILLVLGKKHNKWSFPKGHVEEEDLTGESCAERECKEETGLEVSIPKNVPHWCCNKYIYYCIGPDNVTNGWLLRPEDQNEVAVAKWMTPQQVATLANANSAVRQFVKKTAFQSSLKSE